MLENYSKSWVKLLLSNYYHHIINWLYDVIAADLFYSVVHPIGIDENKASVGGPAKNVSAYDCNEGLQKT